MKSTMKSDETLLSVMSTMPEWPLMMILPTVRAPTIACYEAPETGSEGVMAMVSELAVGFAGFAKTLAKGRANGFRAG